MKSLRPNAAAVAAKVIDGEAIIMNLLNGAYYSMDQAGAAIWEMIEQGRSLEGIQLGLVSRYAVEPARAQADAERLVAELLAEQLVVVSDADDPGVPAAPATASPAAYQSPVLNKYTEMADLLALDPPMPSIGELEPGPDRA